MQDSSDQDGMSIDDKERAQRKTAIDFARASIALEGLVLDADAEALFARYIAGVLSREELNAAVILLAASYQSDPCAASKREFSRAVDAINADIFASAKTDQGEQESGRAGRKKIIDFARASIELEGFTLSPDVEAINQRYIDGDISGDEHVAAIRAYVGIG